MSPNRVITFFALAFFGSLVSLPLRSPAAQEELVRIRFTPLSTANSEGLKSDLIRDLTEDFAGNVWIATDHGLVRFDGWSANNYSHNPNNSSTLSSDQLTSLATTRDRSGSLWIGTLSNGLLKFNQESGTASAILKGTTRGENLLSDNIVDLAISDDQYLWIATDAGLNVLNLVTEKIVVANGPVGSARIASVTTVGKGEIWVGTVAGDLYKWNSHDKEFVKFWTTTVPVTSVARDNKNGIWIGTAGLGLYNYSADESKGEPQRVSLRGNNITALDVDANGELWVGTMNGLALYDRENLTFVYFNHSPRHADSLVDNLISTIFEAKSGILWVGTFGGGTSRFNLDREWFTHIRSNPENPNGLPHSFVRSLATGKNKRLYLGTDHGIAIWNTEDLSFELVPKNGPETESVINTILEDKNGILWLGTKGDGLIRRGTSGESVVFRRNPEVPNSLGHDNVSKIYEDSLGRIFIGTQGGGLYQFLSESNQFQKIIPSDGKKNDFITDLIEDSNGDLWISGEGKIFLLQKGKLQSEPIEKIFPSASRTSGSLATVIFPDSNGIVWIGTQDAGLDRFNTTTGEISNYNSSINALPDDNVVSLIKDDSNFLWVTTQSGIARLNSMQTEFRVFSPDDGLQKDGFNPDAVAKDQTGVLYFGGQDGLNIIDPLKLPAPPRAPNPWLTGFDYFGESVIPKKDGILEKQIAATDEIVLDYDERIRFALHFANVDYRSTNRGEFRYMLEGYDSNWILADDKRIANYANIAPGRYLFKVQSSIDGREWPDVVAKVRIVIVPPWWESWWFKLLGIALLVTMTVGITKGAIRSRVKQLRRREELLTAQRDKAEAALARQLQNRMLLERTTRDLTGHVREDQILSDALHHITEQFGATQCLVQRLVVADDMTQCLKQIGYCSRSPRFPGSPAPHMNLEDRVTSKILESENVVLLSDARVIPASVKDAFPEDESISILATKTSFRDAPNGIVLLFRIGENLPPWTEDDTKLLDALITQFGITIAQINTAAIEETYRQHLEEAKHLAEVASRAKSDFLAKMTHELRTPLNAIIGFSDILGADKMLNPKQRETLDIINNSGEHLLDVINEILDLSKIEAGKMERNDETFEFLPLLKSVYEMISIKAEEKRIAFNFAAKSGLPAEITTDRSKLRQILINLIGNAIKFTAQGGVGVTVSSNPTGESETIDGRMRRPIEMIFEIRDTGRGISEEEIGKLFERYSQTESGRRSSEGTGLGLPIARSLVQLLGGDIVVESILGKGTIFRFTIQCHELWAVESDSVSLSAILDEKTAQRINGFTSAHHEIRILIAEDQPTNRLLLNRILGKAGFILAEAVNGQEAIEKWAAWKPHLILMDEDMPIKKGSEATREIKALATADNDTVIVSLTAYALEQAKLSAIEAGCADFVAKPFRSNELFSVISKHLGVNYTFNDAA